MSWFKSLAKRRLADEYHAAQDRGEVASGRPKSLPDQKTFTPIAADIGLTHKEIEDARQIRIAKRVGRICQGVGESGPKFKPADRVATIGLCSPN